MTFFAIEKAICHCDHRGVVRLEHSQDWVTVDGELLLVKGDLDRRPVSLCNGGAEIVGITRCRTIATVDEAQSHSGFVSIGGNGIVLATARGTTDWTSVGIAGWKMDQPGQAFLQSREDGP